MKARMGPTSGVLVMAMMVLSALPRTALAESVAPSGAVVAAGRVVGATGAAVYVYLARPLPGLTAPLATTTTGAGGAYAVGLTPTAGLDRIAARNGGYLNLDLVAVSGTAMSVRAFSRRWTGSAWVQQYSTDTRLPQIRLSGSPGAVGGVVAPDPGCPPQKILMSTSTAYTAIGEFHTAADASGWFRYGQSADSNIAVGISINGTSWSIGGSVHIGNSRAAAITFNRGANYGKRETTQFQYGKYKWTACGHIQKYEIDALQWTGGAVDGQDNHSFDGQCGTTYKAYETIYGPNTSFERSTSQAITFNAAVTVFGVNLLTAQSGFSTYVVSHWNFGGTFNKHYLCGDDNFVTSSHRIFAGQ